MLWFLGTVVTLIVLAVIACKLYIMHLGKANPVLYADRRTEFKATEFKETSMTVACEMPYMNTGKLLCTIMDCYPRVLLPQEQFSGVKITGRVERADARRDDGYFEAVLVYPQTGGTLIVTLDLEVQNENVRETLLAMPDVNVDVVYQIVDRHSLYINKTRIVLTAREVKSAIEAKGSVMDND
ncbi:MAG: hypothetical protein IJ510_00150 [Selenomonadales bacterium]|nr:hypothetical protein [Selenomonadales bacterium]